MILKCKMCGGDLNPEVGKLVVECEYCGTRQTIPSADSEKKMNLFNRANRLRMSAEFDKAAGVYESIVAEFPEEAEAYWGLCLCAYGIEYVDDPATGKKIPTCHRTLPQPVAEHESFKLACSHADAIATRQYRREAREIDRLQREIFSVAASESPYDVFICYKETGADGRRTQDSVIAQDIYDALTAKGMKVFFARITLEDKLGTQYEPYIYAALHSARVMLAIGTCFEHFDAVWVKNEWSRFLDMMKEDRTKALIPCYSGEDAYDIPAPMRALQAQSMDKLGFMQDLVRGVEKLVDKAPAAKPVSPKSVEQSVQQAVQQAMRNTGAGQQGAGVDSLMRRAQLFLEDGDWDNARLYLDRVLDINPEFAPAYVGKVMVALEVSKEEDIPVCEAALVREFEKEPDWTKAMRFATPEQKAVYEEYLSRVSIEREAERKRNVLAEALTMIEASERIGHIMAEMHTIKELGDIEGADEALAAAREKIACLTKTQYSVAKKAMKHAKNEDDFSLLAEYFGEFGRYRNSAELKTKCQQKAEKLRKRRVRNKKIMKYLKWFLIIMMVLLVIASVIEQSTRSMRRYSKAEKYVEEGLYGQAIAEFVILAETGYADSAQRIEETYYKQGEALQQSGEYPEAVAAFANAGAYSDARQRIGESYYLYAEQLLSEGDYAAAAEAFSKAGTYSDAAQRIGEPYYVQAEQLLSEGDYAAAAEAFSKAGTYSDAERRSSDLFYEIAGGFEQQGEPL